MEDCLNESISVNSVICNCKAVTRISFWVLLFYYFFCKLCFIVFLYCRTEAINALILFFLILRLNFPLRLSVFDMYELLQKVVAMYKQNLHSRQSEVLQPR